MLACGIGLEFLGSQKLERRKFTPNGFQITNFSHSRNDLCNENPKLHGNFSSTICLTTTTTKTTTTTTTTTIALHPTHKEIVSKFLIRRASKQQQQQQQQQHQQWINKNNLAEAR